MNILPRFQWRNIKHWKTTIAGLCVLAFALYLTLRLYKIAPELPGGAVGNFVGLITCLMGPALHAIFGAKDPDKADDAPPDTDPYENIR